MILQEPFDGELAHRCFCFCHGRLMKFRALTELLSGPAMCVSFKEQGVSH